MGMTGIGREPHSVYLRYSDAPCVLRGKAAVKCVPPIKHCHLSKRAYLLRLLWAEIQSSCFLQITHLKMARRGTTQQCVLGFPLIIERQDRAYV